MRWLVLVLGIAANASASLLIKIGLLPPYQLPSARSFSIFTSWPLLLGIVLYGMAFILYVLALRYFPLNVAHPTLTSGAIATVSLLSVMVLGESLRPTMILGLGFMILGVVLLMSGNR